MARTRSRTTTAPPAKRARTQEEPAPVKDAGIAIGDAIPDVDVVNERGETVNLARDYSKGILAVFAYPKASTPGCSRQTSGFGEESDELSRLGATVFGLSADTPKAQTTFKNKTGVDFDLLSDPEFALIGPLGAKKAPRGIIRSHWVFVDGKAVLVDHRVKPDDSPGAVLEVVKKHSSVKSEGDAAKGGAAEDDATEATASEGLEEAHTTESNGSESRKGSEQSPAISSDQETKKEEFAEEPKAEELADRTVEVAEKNPESDSVSSQPIDTVALPDDDITATEVDGADLSTRQESASKSE